MPKKKAADAASTDLVKLGEDHEITTQQLVELVDIIVKPPELDEGDFTTEEARETLDYLKVYQPTSTVEDHEGGKHDGIRMGNFYLSDGAYFSEVGVIPLAVWESRSYFDNKKMLCSSRDGKLPDRADFATACRVCPKKVYREGSKESRCTMTINMLCLFTDFSRKPVVMTFKGTQYSFGKKFISDCKKNGGFGSVAAVFKTQKIKDSANYGYTLHHFSSITADPDFSAAVSPSIKRAKTYWCGVIREMLVSYKEYATAKIAAGPEAASEKAPTPPPMQMMGADSIDEDLM